MGTQLKSMTMSRLAAQLPSSLSLFKVRGYRDWIPDDSILQIKNLEFIRGVSLSDSCTSCTLQRNYTYREPNKNRLNPRDYSYSSKDLDKGKFFYGAQSNCRGQMYSVIGNTTPHVSGYGFFPRCITEREECFNSEILSTPVHRCYDTDNKILNIALLIGPTAMILNLLTAALILTTKSLRNITSMLLVSNMAISDILNSFYTISIVTARKFSYIHFLTFMGSFCQVFGFIWSMGQFSLIVTSVLLTVERYLVIVFAMTPDRKLRSSHALCCVTVFWILAMVSSALPLAGLGTYTANTYCIPFKPVRDRYHSLELTITISIIGTMLYLITFALYVHIFVFVKKAGQVSGNKREHAMAKRIAMLVFSNMIFYFTPVFIGLLWVTTSMAKNLTPITKEVITGSLSTLLFSFNSLLNPILYAFRNDAFMRELKYRLLRVCPNTEGIVPLHSTSDDNEVHDSRRNVDARVTFSERNQNHVELRDIQST